MEFHGNLFEVIASCVLDFVLMGGATGEVFSRAWGLKMQICVITVPFDLALFLQVITFPKVAYRPFLFASRSYAERCISI